MAHSGCHTYHIPIPTRICVSKQNYDRASRICVSKQNSNLCWTPDVHRTLNSKPSAPLVHVQEPPRYQASEGKRQAVLGGSWVVKVRFVGLRMSYARVGILDQDQAERLATGQT